MASDDALLVVDAAGVVVEWSQRARSLFGRGTSEALGHPVAELLAGSWPSADGDSTGAAPGLVVRPVTLRDGGMGWSVDLVRSEESSDAQDRALLNALFTQSPIGMQVLDPQLRVLRVNTAASGMNGFNTRRLLGRRLSDVLRLSDPDEAEAMVREVLATGEPALDRLVRARPPSDLEHEHVYSVSVFRLQNADGKVLGASTAVVDVSIRERALARARVLNAARERVGRSLDLDATCAALIDVLVPAFADAAEVDLLDPVVRGEDPRRRRCHPTYPCGGWPSLRRTVKRTRQAPVPARSAFRPHGSSP